MMTSPVKRYELVTFRLGRRLNEQLQRTHPGVIAHSGPESHPGPDPDDGARYRARHDHVFGDTVPVGPWTVDTSGFLTY
jgi:hypothetical protein